MRVKRTNSCTVRMGGVRPEMLFAYMVAYELYREHDNEVNCVITSARDGQHKRSSDHYKGDAIDLRVWGFSDSQRAKVAKELRERLTDEYEVFDEGDHIHVGYDPSNLM